MVARQAVGGGASVDEDGGEKSNRQEEEEVSGNRQEGVDDGDTFLHKLLSELPLRCFRRISILKSSRPFELENCTPFS